ncbi:glycoside hydrolase family 10 protein [Streptomyces albidus (ex Kaewkla and Franco 2022)]|uniref:glycoside hydrolase family 10 protein n=1 Tax=Streptomyces albidus (ex Kaewkla and Franco 2022) TaxID=722709 RepID=UPI0015EE4181|nr:family 10 glycosylhydrolase [Streptomyces albidus (ex Kaewkla and Franco 2022)]
MRRITRRSFAAGSVGALTGVAGSTNARAAAYERQHGHGHHRPDHGGNRRELRGMWIATVDNRDWPSESGLSPERQQEQLVAQLENARRRRLNTVYFQARPTADALWPSRYEPWSQWLTGTQGKDPGWDPLRFVVREAHRRDLAVEAWFNPYRIALHDDLGQLVPGHPARRHPEWAVTYGGKLYYNPGLPQVRRFVQDAMLDAVARYDIDGVHWDDYFYPYPLPGETFDDSAAFEEYGKDFPDLASWRRNNIDLLVQEAAHRIRRVKPWLRFGISPFGVWRNKTTDPAGSDTAAAVQTYDDLYADTRKWVREGRLDYVLPQIYWHMGFEVADYAKLAPWWAETVRGTRTRLYIGEALYKAGDPAQPQPWQDPAELSRHLTLCRSLPEVEGHIFFSAKEVGEDKIGAMARVVADHYPAARPR